MMTVASPNHLSVLAQELMRGRLVLVVGPEFSIRHKSKKSTEYVRFVEELRRAVAKRLPSNEAGAFPFPLDLSTAAACHLGREALESLIIATAAAKEFLVSDAHRALSSSARNAVFTTNLDDVLSRLIEQDPIAAEEDHARFPDSKLFQLFGSARSPHTLTHDDYEAWPARHPHTWKIVREAILNKTLLFIGYRPADPPFEYFMRWIARETEGILRTHYAWMMDCGDVARALIRHRSGIDAVGFHSLDDYTEGFRQLEEARRRLGDNSNSSPVATDEPEREKYRAAMEATYGTVDISMLTLPTAEAEHAVSLREIYVPPDLDPLNTPAEPDFESVNGRIKAVSTSDSDCALKITLIGRNLKGKSRKEVLYLRGTREVVGLVHFASLDKVILAARSPSQPGQFGDLAQGRLEQVFVGAVHTGVITITGESDGVLLAAIAPGGVTTTRRPADEWLQKLKPLFIIGEPGQGKSTLLRHRLLEAVDLWCRQPTLEPFPVYVRLADWETFESAIDGRLFTYVSEILPQDSNTRRESVDAWLKSPVLWLLDGIDEVRDTDRRDDLRKEIRVLATQRPSDRWVLVSRPGARPAAGLDGNWETVRLSPLSDLQIDAVIRNWRKVGVRGNTAASEKQSIELERGAERRRLMRNPQLLTLAILFYKATRRPRAGRLDFFRHADGRLSEVWRKHGLGTYLPEFLDTLALHGLESGRITFLPEDIRNAATPSLNKLGYTAKDCEEEVKRLGEAADDSLGFLVSRGRERYAFLHPTFQEYYASRALTHRPRHDVGRLLAAHWDDPDWSEVWKLFFPAFSDDDGQMEFLFSTVYAARHPLDVVLHRPERACLAWAGLGFRPISDGVATWKELQNWAREALTGEDSLMRRLCLDALSEWERAWPQDLLEPVLALFRHEDWKTRQAAIGACTGQAEQAEVRRALIESFQDDNPVIRRTAAGALSEQTTDSEVREALSKMIVDKVIDVRRAAADALATRSDDGEVRQTLIQHLKSADWAVRNAVALAVCGKPLHDELRYELLQLILDESYQVRKAACHAYFSERPDPEFSVALLALLQDTSELVRREAARSLAGPARHSNVRQRLLQTLAEDPEGEVREAAATALSAYVEDPEVLQILLRAFADPFVPAQVAAARGISAHVKNPEICNRVLRMLDDDSTSCRRSAVAALAPAVGEKVVREAILKCLDDPEEEVRHSAVKSLALQTSDPHVRRALLKRLALDKPHVRLVAASTLQSRIDEPDVRKAMMDLLSDSDVMLRRTAVSVLAGRLDEDDVRRRIAELIDDTDWRVSQVVAQVMAEFSELPSTRDALLHVLKKQGENSRVRSASAIAFSGTELTSEVIEELRNLLRDPDENVCRAALDVLERFARRRTQPRRPGPSERGSKTQQVFLSYCRDNSEMVGRIHAALDEAGISVWWDERLLAGDKWSNTIERMIRQSSLFILCLSSELEQRRESESVVYEEVRCAIRVMKRRSPNKKFILPVALSECKTPDFTLPDDEPLDSLHLIKLFPPERWDANIAALIHAVNAALGI